MVNRPILFEGKCFPISICGGDRILIQTKSVKFTVLLVRKCVLKHVFNLVIFFLFTIFFCPTKVRKSSTLIPLLHFELPLSFKRNLRLRSLNFYQLNLIKLMLRKSILAIRASSTETAAPTLP